ncbi:M35 family metallo-endopeptidase [Xanthomonas sp. LMG 12460]|uniref:M35 family metallo-endopeptidase n=1 Tax=Xanthomonas sp. LMG 12460 TaxID=1591132 RepID=UPI0012650AB0|nr:M35 family metallo-endopeptidase [Xanthomonas sp. LMG 12460]KAB7777707.1 hypothetical protein CEK66_10875 [Xanthomonas sp. LMG 12460]
MTRALNQQEFQVADQALTNVLALCNQVLGLSDQALARLVGKHFDSRGTAAHLDGYRRDYRQIVAALQRLDRKAAFEFDEHEAKNTIAYVWPNNPQRIYLCAAYFTLDAVEQAGTLVHEASHWTAVRGTDDHAYGERQVRALSYTLKRNTADAYELLVEDLARTGG